MSLGPINALKELEETYQPLLLCEFTFRSGNVLRVSTHPLSATYWGAPTAGSYEYGGHPWDPRVMNQDLGPTQAMSELGVDIAPQASITLADPDKVIYKNWEISEGFKGAILRLYAVAWNISDSSTGAFSSDSPTPIKFIGTCLAPNYDDRSLTVTAVSLLNMTSMQMPPTRVQPLCGWSFPTNAGNRSASVSSGDSFYKECAYAPDFGGAGNRPDGTSGMAFFTSCDYSFDSCITRLGDASLLGSSFVPIEKDQLGHPTGRFGGFQWIPNQNSGLQRPYISGKWEEIVNATNEARYGDFVPMCYGLTWVEPLVMGVWGDGNYSNFEVLICYGFVNQIIKVVVNGVEVPHYGYGAGMGVNDLDVDPGHRPDDNQVPSPSNTDVWKNNYWKTINRGLRDSTPNPNNGWGRKGDPYGSCCAIHIQCLRELASESSIPTIQILLQGSPIRSYSNVDTFVDNDFLHCGNPAWILMDILVWSNWRYEDMDIQSFIDAAAKCDQQIYFNRMDGTYSNVFNEGGTLGSINYPRYGIGFCVRQRTSIGELIRGIRNAMKAMLYFDSLTGKLRVVIKETLGSQQPNPIDGSNYTNSISSVDVAGLDADGFVAYSFDDSNIIKENGKSSLTISQKTNQDSPNKVTVSFLNRENQFSQDSATIVDAEDIARIGQEVFGSFSVVGPQTFDHVRRVVNTWFAENYRGNPRYDYEGSWIGDTGGTIIYDLLTTVRGIHLTVGQLCLVSDQQSGTAQQLARITKIQPTTNFETVKVTLQFHNDNWYQDTYGQVNQPKYARPRSMVNRKPFSWRPGVSPLFPNETYWPQNRLGFFVQTGYNKTLVQSGYGSNLAGAYSSYMRISGIVPANSFPDAPGRPLLEIAGSAYVSGAGGFPSGKSYYVALAAKTTSAAFGSSSETPCSAISKTAVVPMVPPNDSISVKVLNWPDNPVGYYAFVGDSPDTMTYQREASANPAGINLDGTRYFPGIRYPFANFLNSESLGFYQYCDSLAGSPDEAFSRLRFRARSVLLPGAFSFRAKSVSSDGYDPSFIDPTFETGTTHLQIAMPDGVTFATDEWAGREISLYGRDLILESYLLQNAPKFTPGNFKVIGNSSDTLHIAGVLNGYTAFSSNPQCQRSWGYGQSYLDDLKYVNKTDSGDNRFVIRVLPTFGTDAIGNYFEDSGLINPLVKGYAAARVAAADNTTPIVLHVNFAKDTRVFGLGYSVLVQGVLGNAAANGYFVTGTATLTSTTAQFPLYDYDPVNFWGSASVGGGSYSGDGVVFLANRGLTTDELVGKLVFVIAGAGEGTSVPVLSNTDKRIYIQGEWPVPPDETTRVIIVDSTYLSDLETPAMSIGIESAKVQSFLVDTSAYPKNAGILVQAATVSSNGAQSLAPNDPFVEKFLFNRYAYDGSINISVAGTLSAGSNVGPLTSVNEDVRPARIVVQVSSAPSGSDLVLKVRAGGSLLTSVTVVDGETIGVSDVHEILSWACIIANEPITVDIVSAGGAVDLSATVYFNVN
jgi:hypothetical protein